MKTITKFDRGNVEDVRREAMAAVNAALAAYGLQTAYAGGRYSDDKFSIKIDLNIMAESESGEAMPASFPRDAARCGLPADCYGAEFSFRGDRYKVCGIKPRNRKYPVICERMTGFGSGRNYKMEIWCVKNALSNSTEG